MAALNYIIAFNILFSLLIGVYYLALRNNADFKFNRAYLLGIAGFSLITPLLNIPVLGNAEILKFPLLTDESVSSNTALQTNGALLSTQELIAIGYGTLSLVFLTVLIVKIVGLYKQVQAMKAEANFDQDHNIYILTRPVAPFTFLKWSFIPADLQQEKEAPMIIAHEQSHAKGLHSVDIIIAELMSCLLFMNPLHRIYKKCIAENHEYLADAEAVQTDNKSAYTEILIKQTLYPTHLSLVSFFAKPTIFNRIHMMKTPKRNLKKQYIALLAGLLFISVIACDFQSGETVAIVEDPKFSGEVETVEVDTDRIFTIVENQAEPKGGIQAFYDFISGVLSDSYPKQAQRMGIEGVVYVQFTIEKDGSLTSITPVKGIGGGCDEVAVKAIESFGPWIPGKQRGQVVRSQRVVPIRFVLN